MFAMPRGDCHTAAATGQSLDLTENGNKSTPAVEIVMVNLDPANAGGITLRGGDGIDGRAIVIPPGGHSITIRGRFYQVRLVALAGAPILSLFWSYGA